MKVLRKMAIGIFAVGILFSASACNSSSASNSLRKELWEYYADILEETNKYTADSGTAFYIFNLDKEDSSSNPRVVMELLLSGSTDATDRAKATYQWCKKSVDERKNDLRELGDLLITFAKDQNWKNDYYLYISVLTETDLHVVYDYETQTLWIPTWEDTFQQMYEKFGAMSIETVTETEEGKEFVLDAGLAIIKHNELEKKQIFSYTVYIKNSGEFSSYGEDDSIRN